jgi:magnesium-transporting ATPase (P-type)
MRFTEPPTVVLTLGAALTSGNPEVVGVVLSSGEELRSLDTQLPELSALFGAAILCNDAGFGDSLGGPVDEALLAAAKEHGLEIGQLRRTWVRMEKLPFDAERRLMATLHISTSGGVLTLVKGAPEEILRRTRSVGQGEARPFEEKERALFERKVSDLARRGSKVLAIAYRPGRAP